MTINDSGIYEQSVSILHSLYGNGAKFRCGQYEAIEATLLHNRTLVVQRTGWGKSLVYFVCTKILREKGSGVTLVISPLLTLMDNQMDAAGSMKLKCDALNSKTHDRRDEIINKIIDGKLDIVFITPETLFSDDIQQVIGRINIGLFVIDEAHCVSDWGHDFRLDYSNIYKVLDKIPQNVPVLATTATANDRVVKDLEKQLGGDVYVSKGLLLRDNLSIQVLNLPTPAERYAWIAENVPILPGSGIIYCLTQRDCDHLSDFLNMNGINACPYYSRDKKDEYLNDEAEHLFMEDKIKVLVATVKLGMGYDKQNVSFIIHYQQPSNVVAYYQQIGRAGRKLPKAYTFLMCGEEDADIQNFFIDTAFPTEDESAQVMNAIMENTENGIRTAEISDIVNINMGRLQKTLDFLLNGGYIVKDKAKYFVTPKIYSYNKEHYDAIVALRHNEQRQMQEMTRTKECYNRFIVRCLDDNTSEVCGQCANCTRENLFPYYPDKKYIDFAEEYLNKLIIRFEPRKQWAATSFTDMKKTRIEFQNEVGICLCQYGYPGYGEMVKQGKYADTPRFCDELVEKSAEVLTPFIEANEIDAITCIPSLRSNLVKDFTMRLAERCNIRFVELLEKTRSVQQKTMKNSSHQCNNAMSSFKVIDGMTEMPQKVLLVDDIVDSKWTLTVCGYQLMKAGCEKVYPFALASSSTKEE